MPEVKKKKLSQVVPKQTTREPVWKGPEEDGVTFSLLSKWLVCRERARVQLIEGLRPRDQFNHRIHYGQMWHECEEAYARGGKGSCWEHRLHKYCYKLIEQYPYQRDDVKHWWDVCAYQFPIYVDYWEQNQERVERTPLLQEGVFRFPYKLPSSRVVILRGKFDSVDLVDGKIWLQENKTKGDVNRQKIERQLTFDLQTMLYLVALQEWKKESDCILTFAPCEELEAVRNAKISGVRYNVVKRPLSGGKGAIRKRKPSKSNPLGESDKEFYLRLKQYFIDFPEEFFMRWDVEVSAKDIERFKTKCLNPILEQLCGWYDWVSNEKEPFRYQGNGENGSLDYCFPAVHWQFPLGIYNPLLEGGQTDFDAYLETGNEVGLTRVDNLFPELE